MIQTVQHRLAIQTQQFLGSQRISQGTQVLPAGVALLGILDAIGRQLLQQQATGATAVGVQPEARRQLFGSGEVVGQALSQIDAIQIDDALIALTIGGVDGDRQHTFGHQLAQGSARLDLLGMVAGDTAHITGAGTLDHQQRHGTAGAGLENQQPVEFERADQQRSGSQQFAEQLGDGFRVAVLGQDMLEAVV